MKTQLHKNISFVLALAYFSPAAMCAPTSWSEITGKPAGFADDVDDTGIVTEDDPQVGSNTTNYVPKWGGNALVRGSIYDSGNVGIGTTSPDALFEVAGGNILVQGTRIGSVSNGKGMEISLQDFSGCRPGDVFCRGRSLKANIVYDENALRLLARNLSLRGVGSTGSPNLTDGISIRNGGRVGIGIENVEHIGESLTIGNSMETDQSIKLQDNDAPDSQYGGITYNSANNTLKVVNSGDTGITVDRSGKVGIGTSEPHSRTALHVQGSDNDGTNAVLLVKTSRSSQYMLIDGNEIDAMDNIGATTMTGRGLHLNNNSKQPVHVPTLRIDGGSDLSENFRVGPSAKDLLPEAGLVVSIDPRNPGELAVSSSAYDRRVAGVISGAGGVNPGLLMGQKGSTTDGHIPVALSGRVYCRADAANGAIEPGDLLTTSDVPGHAMKVTDYSKAQGAILGKAMSPLIERRGFVLVLVTLQ